MAFTYSIKTLVLRSVSYTAGYNYPEVTLHKYGTKQKEWSYAS